MNVKKSHGGQASFFIALLIIGVCGAGQSQESDPSSASVSLQDQARLEKLKETFFAFFKQGQYKEAVEPGEEILALQEKLNGAEHSQTADALTFLGIVHFRQGDAAKAETLYARALAVREKILPDDDPLLPISMDNLASSQKALRKYESAVKLYLRSLEIRSKSQGVEHDDSVRNRIDVGLVYFSQGDYTSALPYFQRALKIRENVLGPEHQDTAVCVANIAHTYRGLNNYAAAEPFHERVAAIHEKIHGLKSSQTISDLNDLAFVRFQQGKHAEAAPVYLQILSLRKEVDGENHPNTATAAANCGNNLFILNNFEAAKPFYLQALEIRQKSLGNDHPDTLLSHNDLAGVFKKLGDGASAVSHYQQVVDIREKLNGPQHPSTADAWTFLGLAYFDQEKFAEAEGPFEQALLIREMVLKPEEPLFKTSLINLAKVYREQEKFGDAAELWKRVLRIDEARYGSEHQQVADTLNRLAREQLSLRNYSESQKLFERALQISEAQYGADHPETGAIANNLAFLYMETGAYDDAESYFKRALKISEEVNGRLHEETGEKLDNLGLLYLKQRNYSAAKSTLAKALDIREKTLGAEHRKTAINLNNLAIAHEELGDYQTAGEFKRRALSIDEKTFGFDHPKTSASINNLAVNCRLVGRFSEAEALFRRSLAIDETVHGKSDIEIAPGLNNLASVCKDQGKFDEARTLYLRALGIQENILGESHPDLIVTLSNLGSFARAMGQFEESEAHYRKALRIAEATYGVDHIATTAMLNGLGVLYETYGDFETAVTVTQRCLSIREKKLGARHPDTAEILSNLAVIFKRQKNYPAAESHGRKALEIREEVLGPNHPDTAKTLGILATVYDDLGKFKDAEQLYTRALKSQEAALGPDHPDLATTLNNLGFLNRKMAKFPEARELYRRALKIEERVFAPSHPSVASSLSNMAILEASDNRLDQAAELFDRSRHSIRSHVAAVLPGLSEEQQRSYLKVNYQDSFHDALSLVLESIPNQALVDLSAAWLINGKAVAQEALAERNLLTRFSDDPLLRDLTAKLLSIRAELAGLAMSTPMPGQADEMQKQYKALLEDEQQLARKAAAGGNAPIPIAKNWIALQQIKSALPQQSVFIDLARFDRTTFKFEPNREHTKPESHYVAWITSHEEATPTMMVDLGDAEEIDELIQAARQVIESAPGDEGTVARQGNEAATESAEQHLERLAQRIWWPMLEHIGDTKQILLSPDGSLWLAPWTALPSDKSGEQYLLEKHSVQLLSSARDLVRDDVDKAGGPAVILANPQYNQDVKNKTSAIQSIFKKLPTSDADRTRSFAAMSTIKVVSPLPNTDIEARAVQPQMDEYTAQKTTVYTQQYALERVAKSLHGPQVAMFATHGFFLPTQTLVSDSNVGPATIGSWSSAVDLEGNTIENPLLRCGLLMAGCNNGGAVVGDDDGLLTGLEIVGIDFRGTELVVLSACQTGIGDVRDGEGVAGLRQAFQLAGAKSVVATLWEIPDRDSTQLMIAFFQSLARKESKSAALRAAQLKVIEIHRKRFGAAHPFYWAAFTLTGLD